MNQTHFCGYKNKITHMKKLLFFAMLLVQTAQNSFAQKAEPIVSFALCLKSGAYYTEQISLWKAEIDKDKTNSYAWYNYYRANRNAIRKDTSDHRSFQEKNKALQDLVIEMEKAVPNSYDYAIVKWMNEGNNFTYLPYLKKAEELGSNRTEHYPDMMGWGEVTRDLAKKEKYSKLMYENTTVSPGLMYYNYNVLAGLKPNAILITCGDNDTYPAWMQQALGFRKDVYVINAYLIHIESYRTKLFKELGIEPLKPNEIDTTSYEKEQKWYDEKLIKTLASNKKGYPVYLALTCGENFTKPIEENLYLTGLAYEYSTTVIDNLALLKRNFEQVYLLDYIQHSFFTDISEYYSKLTHCNYIVPMIKLYEHYMLSGENQKAETLKELVLNIVKGTDQEAQTISYFKQ